jgi:hypothetical protein
MNKRQGVVQNFTMTNASQASLKFGSQTRRVLVSAGSTGTIASSAFILFGDSTGLTVSSTNGTLIPMQWVEEFDVTAGQTFYTISSSTASSGLGFVSLTELS